MTDISHFPTRHGRVQVTAFNGQVLRHGKDLGVVTRYAAKHPITVVELRILPTGGYGMAFHFEEPGALMLHSTALSHWNDWRVGLIFLQGRRSWGIERLSVENEALWTEVRDHWAGKRLLAKGTAIHIRHRAKQLSTCLA